MKTRHGSSSDAEKLLAAIREAPDDVETYLVLADVLGAAGDPQGELIVLMHGLSERPDDAHLGSALDAHLTKHRTKLFGSLAKHRGIAWDLHLGFLRSVRYMPDVGDDAGAVLRELLELPIARVLRDLVVFAKFDWMIDKARAAVDASKPATLSALRFAKQHVSLEDALADGKEGEDAVWLALDVDDDVPPEVTKLVNLEWLELRSDTLRALPRELASLGRLRRLDVDWSYSLRSIPDEIFGIESLSYVSMYDCKALGPRYHMGRVNDLLGGFARAKAPRERRVFEAALLTGGVDRAFEVANGAPAATRPRLLAALDSNVREVREEALRGLARHLPDPFAGAKAPLEGASLALLGSTSFDRKDLAARLGERGAKLTTKVDAKTTHVIVGQSPRGKQAGIGSRPIVLESHLSSILTSPRAATDGAKPSAAKAKKTPAAAGPAATKDDIARSLATRDDATVGRALASLHADGVPADLFPAIVVVAQDVALGKSRQAAKKLLAIHAPAAINDAIREHLKSSLLLDSLGETKRAERLAAFCAAAGLDPLELAELLARRARVGLKYLFQNAPSERVTRVLDAIATQQTEAHEAKAGDGSVPGRRLDLGVLEIAEVPEEVAALDVAFLDLHGNHLSSWPEPVLSMPSLRALNLSSNYMPRVPDSAAKLQLTSLDLSHCKLRKFPRPVLEMTTLERLNLSSAKQYVQNEARIPELPPEIGRLKRLRSFAYAFNILETIPDELFELRELEELSLFQCTLPKRIPEGFAKLEKLRKLRIGYSDWASRSEELSKLLPDCEIDA